MNWTYAAQFQERCLRFEGQFAPDGFISKAIPTYISSEFMNLIDYAKDSWESEMLEESDFSKLTHIFAYRQEGEFAVAQCWLVANGRLYIQGFDTSYGHGKLAVTMPEIVELPCPNTDTDQVDRKWLQVLLRLCQQKIMMERPEQMTRQMRRSRLRKGLQATDIKVLTLREIEYEKSIGDNIRATPRIHPVIGHWRRLPGQKQTFVRGHLRGSGEIMPKYKGININR